MGAAGGTRGRERGGGEAGWPRPEGPSRTGGGGGGGGGGGEGEERGRGRRRKQARRLQGEEDGEEEPCAAAAAAAGGAECPGAGSAGIQASAQPGLQADCR